MKKCSDIIREFGKLALQGFLISLLIASIVGAVILSL